MNQNRESMTFRAIGLGAIIGLRSMSGPAFLSRAVVDGRVRNLEDTRFAVLGSPKAAIALSVLQLGELVGDKLPTMSSRTNLLPLLGRATFGALVVAALFVSEDRNSFSGGLLGAGAAVTAAYTGEKLRASIVEDTALPDQVVALLEDGIVLLGGSLLLR